MMGTAMTAWAARMTPVMQSPTASLLPMMETVRMTGCFVLAMNFAMR
jgi:hypothetical protein